MIGPIRSKAIREAARGERCTVEIVGICNGDPATVVFAHFRDEGKGMARKADDISGAFACSACHDFIDRTPHDLPREELLWHMLRAMQRTIRRLIEKGILKLPDFQPEGGTL